MKVGMRVDMPAHFSVVVDLNDLAAERGCTVDDLTQEHVWEAARLIILDAAYVMNRPSGNICMSPEVDRAHFFDLCTLPDKKGQTMLFVKIRLTDNLSRAIPHEGCHNEWPAGTEFYVQQERPDCGMIVVGGPNAGVGVPPEIAEVTETFASWHEMQQAIQAAAQDDSNFHRLQFLFWKRLDRDQRVSVLTELGILSGDFLAQPVWLRRGLDAARHQGKLRELWDKVMCYLPANQKESNPFLP